MVHFQQSNGSGQDNTYCTSNSLTNRPPDWSSRVLGNIWIQKYVAQMHIYWVLETFPSLSHNYVRVFGVVTGSCDWRSKAQYKFGQHFGHNNSASKLAWNWWTNRNIQIPCQFHDSSTEVPGHYQVTIMVPSWILKSHAQKISQNYGIVLAEINRRFTAPPDTIFFSIFWDLERQPNRHKR